MINMIADVVQYTFTKFDIGDRHIYSVSFFFLLNSNVLEQKYVQSCRDESEDVNSAHRYDISFKKKLARVKYGTV